MIEDRCRLWAANVRHQPNRRKFASDDVFVQLFPTYLLTFRYARRRQMQKRTTDMEPMQVAGALYRLSGDPCAGAETRIHRLPKHALVSPPSLYSRLKDPHPLTGVQEVDQLPSEPSIKQGRGCSGSRRGEPTQERGGPTDGGRGPGRRAAGRRPRTSGGSDDYS
jgi:hypothetical protein